MMAMTLLHWLISEALFMVDMQVLDPNGNKMYGDSSESGTSFYGKLASLLTCDESACLESILTVSELLEIYGR